MTLNNDKYIPTKCKGDTYFQKSEYACLWRKKVKNTCCSKSDSTFLEQHVVYLCVMEIEPFSAASLIRCFPSPIFVSQFFSPKTVTFPFCVLRSKVTLSGLFSVLTSIFPLRSE